MLERIYIWFLIHHLKQWYGYKAISTDVIYAQAKHETGNFTSDIYKENNNLFGMRQPSIRKTLVTGKNRNHGTYKSRFDSIRDYFMRQKYFKIPATDDESYMLKTERSGYAEDGSYMIAWRRHLGSNDFTKTQILLMRYGGLIIALLCIIGIYKVMQDEQKNSFNGAVKKFENNNKLRFKYE